MRRKRGDKFGIRARAEAHELGNVLRRYHLKDAQSIFSVGHQREHRRVDGADLHGAGVVQRAGGVVHSLQLRFLRIRDVDESESFGAVGHISVSAGEIKALSVLQRHHGAGDKSGPGRFGNVHDLETFIVRDKRVTELHADGTRVFQQQPR